MLPNTLFTLATEPTPFALEIYISFQEQNFSVHPISFTSNNKKYIDRLPNEIEWSNIFALFPFKNTIDFAHYYGRVSSYLEIEESDLLLKGYGLSATPKIRKEMKQLMELKEEAIDFYIEKSIPVDILIFVYQQHPTVLKRIAPFLLQPHIKKNIAKEILNELPEISKEKIEILFSQFLKITEEVKEDGKVFLNQHYKKIVFDITYPQSSKLKQEKEQKLKDLKIKDSITIEYDPYFESDSLTLKTILKNKNDFDLLKSFLNAEETSIFFNNYWK